MTPSELAQIILESCLYKLRLYDDALDKQIERLHDECEREHIQSNFYWVQYGK